MSKSEENFDKDLMKVYGWSKNKNFRVVDTLPEKHAYCITPKHVTYASDHHGGMLGEEAIKGAEKEGVDCGVRECIMKYEDHKHGLVVQCLKEPKNKNKFGKECQTYLKKIVKTNHFKEHDYIGVVLLESWA